LSTSSTNLPTSDQLAASRLNQWHQQGEALLTFENLRSWINATGLVLFSSRSQQLPAPAPSLVEAVLGASNANPVLADTEQARSILARLINEGIAVPLNLLGTPGETPDFVASAPVFAYIFTLRGDKAWKQPPATSGALKVSPLALATYKVLTERITMSAYDLATQLGKEVTESAVLRALNELWVHLRVLPVPQPDGAPTLWELTSGRFTKLMKAGANAGQPSALSALISLYLNTAIVATEEEIETFLSPLAARSRIRDVIHALMSARQLETIAIEGRTVLHVAGELPSFLAPEGSVVIDADAAEGIAADAVTDAAEPQDGAPRITKFIAKPRKIGTGFVKKSESKPAFRSRPSFGSGREWRPFKRGDQSTPGGPSFSKPWQEKTVRPASVQAPVEGAEASTTAPEGTSGTYTPKPRVNRGGDRPAFSRKPSFGGKPSFGNKPSFSRNPDRDERSGRDDRPDRPDRGARGDRPTHESFAGRSGDAAEGRPPRREFTPRSGGDSSDARPPRKTFSKPGTFARQREGGFAGKANFGPPQDRPPRREFSRDSGDARSPRREFTPRASGGSSDSRPPRREFSPRSGSDRPSFGGPRRPGSFSPRPQGGVGGDRRPSTPRGGGQPGEGSSRFGAKPSGGFSGDSSGDRRARTGGPPFRKFDAPRSDRPTRPPFGSDRPTRPSFDSSRPARREGPGGTAGKSGTGFAGRKPFGTSAGRPSAGKPAGTFDKFKNNAKPFGKRPPARKYRSDESEPKG